MSRVLAAQTRSVRKDSSHTGAAVRLTPMRYSELAGSVVALRGEADWRGLLGAVAAAEGCCRQPAAIPLCGSPWSQPRNPTRDIGPKGLILRAKCLRECRFLVHHNNDVKKKPE